MSKVFKSLSSSRKVSAGLVLISILASGFAVVCTRIYWVNHRVWQPLHFAILTNMAGILAIIFWITAIMLLCKGLYVAEHYIRLSRPVVQVKRIQLLNVMNDEFIWPGDQFLRYEDLGEDERDQHCSGRAEPGVRYSYVYNNKIIATTIPLAVTDIHYAAHSRPCIHISEKVIYLEDTWGFPPERLEVHDRREFHYDLFLPEEWIEKIS